jgi:hypothetical protein
MNIVGDIVCKNVADHYTKELPVEGGGDAGRFVIDIGQIQRIIFDGNANLDSRLDFSSTRYAMPFPTTTLTYVGDGTDYFSGRLEYAIIVRDFPDVANAFALSGGATSTVVLTFVCRDRGNALGFSTVIGRARLFAREDRTFALASPGDAHCGSGYCELVFSVKDITDGMKRLASQCLAMWLMANLLLNCKNVHAREQPCSLKLAKRYQERHGHKRPRYYVLDIEPMRQKFRDANGGKDGISLAKALHICRGHFKDYREKPLFGKVSGMFWWQPHVRGTAEAGIVEKDYRIKL